MIAGVFSDREARVPLVVLGPSGEKQGVAAIVDTGFSGFLTLPTSVIEALELPWLGRGQALVGDGTHQASTSTQRPSSGTTSHYPSKWPPLRQSP